jgi:hypothetical protein
MEGVREPLRTGTLLGVHNTCGSRVRFFSHVLYVWREPVQIGLEIRLELLLASAGFEVA